MLFNLTETVKGNQKISKWPKFKVSNSKHKRLGQLSVFQEDLENTPLLITQIILFSKIMPNFGHLSTYHDAIISLENFHFWPKI